MAIFFSPSSATGSAVPGPSFSVDARGLCVEDLQLALNVKVDGHFGPNTRKAIQMFQSENGLPGTGEADAALHSKLGLTFPSEFDRCLGLTCSLEGTGWGDCNSTDIDGAGLTLGVVGYTSRDGEVQAILNDLFSQDPSAAAAFGPRSGELLRLIDAQEKPEKWRKFFYGSGEGMAVLADILAGFKILGTNPTMRELQKAGALEKWEKSEKLRKSLKFSSMASQGLFFDIVVQNGGFEGALPGFQQMELDGKPESERLEGAARAIANRIKPKFQQDVLTRKLLFARGSGTVHDDAYSLKAQAFA